MSFPAARITDPHICPLVTVLVPHVGGPVAGPCAPTVLTGGLPQARVGDMCVCVGPPDAIAWGSFNVIVSGSMAARMLDPTIHGGMIAFGFPTVLIGTRSPFGGGGGAPAPAPQSPECAQLEAAMNDAMLADHTYGENPALPPGYTQLDPNTPEGQREIRDLGLQPNELAPEGSTFRAEIFRRDTPTGPAYTVAYRGTAESADWIQNAQQGVGMESDHYERAMRIGSRVSQNADNVSFTGHSLGGGLASAAAARTGRPANTFNSAGLSARTVGGYPDPPAPVQSYNVPGEVLSGVQDNRATVLGGLTGAATAVHPSLGGLVGGWITGRELGDSPILPQAYGERNTLPLVAPPGKEIYDGWNPITGVKHSVDRHGMDWVKAGLEQQQRDQGCL
jgi:uncharacterized Zn-binding protein involved in type VI secretion